jgi:hypothetical protein
MVEAGENALLFALGGAVSEPWFPREVAISVYLAMAFSRAPLRIRSRLDHQRRIN